MLNIPAKSHWIIKRWFKFAPSTEAPDFYNISVKPAVAVIFSDHTKNPHLAQEVHDRYEG
jgi:hypothetical protein